MKKKSGNSVLFPASIAFFAGIIYLVTASQGTLWLDSGRILAAMVSLGIPNPPDPLYVMLGHLFTLLPIGSVVFRVQLLSAILAGIALYLVYSLAASILTSITSSSRLPKSQVKTKIAMAAFVSFMTLGFSYEFWSQAQNIEVFLIVVVAELLVFKILLAPSKQKNQSKGILFKLLPMAVVFGLAAGTNPIIISVMPAVLWFLWGKRKYVKYDHLVISAVVGVVVVALVYSYIPLAASHNPFLNWGRPNNWKGFLEVTTGQGLNVYQPQLGRINGFTGAPEVIIKSVFNYFRMFFFNFTILIPFIGIGAYYLYKKNKYFFTLFGVVVLANFIFVALYLSGMQEAWMLVSDVIFAICSGLGFFYVSTELLEKWLAKVDAKKYFNLAHAGLFLLAFIPLIIWWPTLHRSDLALTDDYVANLYKPIQGPAILFGSSDLFDSMSYYVHDVLGKKDIVPVTDNILYILRWYRDNLTATNGLTMPDDSQLTYNNPAEYSQYINDFFADNIKKYHIYITYPALRNNFLPTADLGPSLTIDTKRFKLVPQGMLMQLVDKNASVSPNLKNFEFTFQTPNFPTQLPTLLENVNKSELTGMVNEYMFAFESLGDAGLKQLTDQGSPTIIKGSQQDILNQVLKYYLEANAYNPKNSESVSRLGNFYGVVGDHQKAIDYFTQALKLDPTNLGIIFNLGLAYEHLGNVDQAVIQYRKVLKLAKTNSQIGQDAFNRLQALQSTDVQAPKGWKTYQNNTAKLSFAYPPTFTVTEQKNGVIQLSNNLKGKDNLTFLFYSKTAGPSEQLQDLEQKLPFYKNAYQLNAQQGNIIGFESIFKTYADGSDTFLIFLLKRNNQEYGIKIFPGQSTQGTYFNQILQTFKGLD